MLQALTCGSARWLEPWDLERKPGLLVEGCEHGDDWPFTARRDIRSSRPPKTDKEEHRKRAPRRHAASAHLFSHYVSFWTISGALGFSRLSQANLSIHGRHSLNSLDPAYTARRAINGTPSTSK